MTTSLSGRAVRQPQRRGLPGTTWMSRLVFYVFMTVLVLVYLVPISWVVSTSLRTEANLYDPGQWFPHPITLEHYRNLYSILTNLWRYVFNTVLIAGLTTVGLLFSCSTAGYALARMRFPGSRLLMAILLLTLMIPVQVTFVPLYTAFRVVHWINTPLPLIVPAFFGNAFATFFFRQFFRTIPRELEEAATVDGAGRWRTYWAVILPLSKSALAAMGLVTFVQSWNNYFLPSWYLQSSDQQVLTQALLQLTGYYTSQWGEIVAGVVLMTLPMILLYVAAQRYFVQGITFHGLKM